MKTTNDNTQFNHNPKPASLAISRRLPSCIFGLMLALSLCGAVPKANAIVFFNQDYGTCLDASGAALKTFINGGACNATFAQQWDLEGFQIQGIGSNATTGYTCIWATGGINSGVVTAPCKSGKAGWSNRWYLYNGSFINADNGLCMDLEGGPATPITLQNCTGATNQLWSARS